MIARSAFAACASGLPCVAVQRSFLDKWHAYLARHSGWTDQSGGLGRPTLHLELDNALVRSLFDVSEQRVLGRNMACSLSYMVLISQVVRVGLLPFLT